jgi:tripartite-type tricarboxylate transporter receptor subunit TctC
MPTHPNRAGGKAIKIARRAFLHRAAGVAALAALPRIARARLYPTRPVRIIVPLPPGSAPDIQARIYAEQLGKLWGAGAIVVNRAGGGGAIGTQALLSAPPDGHTLLYAVSSIFVVLPAQRDRPSFDVNRDLIPIGLTSNQGFVLAASSKLGINTLGELITLAKKEPYKLIIGTNPAGSLPHLAALLFVQTSHAPLTVVPSYGGTNDAIREIMGGRVHVVIEGLPALRGALDAGDLKALAIMSHERTPAAPDIPIAAETVPGLFAFGWGALVAAKGTPPAVVEQLTEDLRKVVDDRETHERLERIGLPPFRPTFGADLARFIEVEQKLWWPIVKAELK